MRVFLTVLVVLASMGVVVAADKPKKKKLDAKTILGKWDIKYVGGKEEDKNGNWIELREDGTFTWKHIGSNQEGKFKLNGTTLELYRKDLNGGAILWKDLSLKDGKIIHPVATGKWNELSRAEEKKDEGKKDK